MKRAFYFKDNHLYCEDVDLQKFSQGVSTPYYLYSAQRIVNNCQTVLDAGKGLDFLPCYALKANYNPQILKIVREMGFGADVVSGGELQFALKAGFPPEKIVFAGVGKQEWEIELAVQTGIHSLNIESEEEFALVCRVTQRLQKTLRVAFRINPDIEAHTHDYITTGRHLNKFGIPLSEALTLYERAAQEKFLQPVGVHVHIGSQILQAKPFLEAAEYLKNVVAEIRRKGLEISTLDLGGGIGIDYEDDFSKPQSNYPLKEILPQYLQALKDLNVTLAVELGRSIIGDAGILVSRVLYRKQTPLKRFLIVDAAMNNLIRPSLYQAFHPIVPLVHKESPRDTFDVVGPVCESGDFLAKERELPVLEPGDLIAVGGAGAYGQALASVYNLRPLIAEYLVRGDEVQTIFKGQTIEEIAKQYEW